MLQRKLKKIYFIEDSSDEIFLSRMLFRHHKIDLEIEHLRNMEDFFEKLRHMDTEQADEALVVVDLNLTLTKGTEGIRRLRHSRSSTPVSGLAYFQRYRCETCALSWWSNRRHRSLGRLVPHRHGR